MIRIKEGVAITLTLFMLLFPLCLMGSDLFGNVTFQGKVIDADTLKPIEGAVVVFEWEKCWPGIGAGGICNFKMVKESTTDINGDWEISGPKGTYNPGVIRSILGYIASWTSPPDIFIYKPGYCRTDQDPRVFHAYPFAIAGDIEGIVMIRKGETRKERDTFNNTYGYSSVPFIAMNDPESKLRKLNFNFQYPKDVRKIEIHQDNIYPPYTVTGIIKAKTQEEKIHARILPGNVKHWERLPLLRKMVENSYFNSVTELVKPETPLFPIRCNEG